RRLRRPLRARFLCLGRPAHGDVGGLSAGRHVLMTALPTPESMSATLEVESKRVPATLYKAARLSLYVKLPEDHHFADGTIFERVVVHTADRDVLLTRCRLELTVAAPAGANG